MFVTFINGSLCAADQEFSVRTVVRRHGEIREERARLLREALPLRKRLDEIFKQVSLLQDEELNVQERARFLSDREVDLLDAFANPESRGGGTVILDSSLEAVVPGADMVADEWLQFVDPDFFGTAGIPVNGQALS